ncbi:BatD family protein [Neptuniibacter sp. UBA6509]|uniref:BatD family protein n=2 Tax=unclassified Neptuniibacter TaxID=2630693 RepID=UPI0025E535BE|nr:BatD family protein [Neptuniibacter sp. UBA6509]
MSIFRLSTHRLGAFRLSALVFLLSISGLLHAGISSQIDRQVISQGETFRLMLSITKNDASQIDLSPLDDNFEVVSRSHQSSTRIINGSIESSTKLVLTLAPKKAGILSIPVLNLAGEKSEPLQIEVKKVEQPSAVDGGVELLSTLSDESPNVQQPVIYQMNLVLGQRIFNAAFQEPKIKQGKALIEALGEQKQYRQTLNGREMLVVEQSWMITPQQSGVLEIEGAQLSAEVPSRQSGRDPYRRYNDPRAMRRIFVSADSYTLEVASIPAEFSGEQWLTASELKLTSHLSSEKWKQGEPVTRTITLQAEGMSEAQLPTIKLADVDGLKQYAAKPVKEQFYIDNQLASKMEIELTLIPSKSGVLDLPEFRLPWWDNTTNSQKVAIIPAQSVEVLPTEGANLAHLNSDSSSSNDQDLPPVLKGNVEKERSTQEPDIASFNKTTDTADRYAEAKGVSWLWFMLGCLVSLVIGVIISVVVMKKRIGMVTVSDSGRGLKHSSFSINALKKACTNNDPQIARAELLKWLQHSDPSIKHLNNLDGVVPAELLDQITQLNRCNFSSETITWSGKELLSIVSHMKEISPSSSKSEDVLEPLYTN